MTTPSSYAALLGDAWREVGVATDGNYWVLLLTHRKIECGNGVVDDGELCDDNNTVADDGCSDSCRLEPNFNCSENTFRPTTLCLTTPTSCMIFVLRFPTLR